MEGECGRVAIRYMGWLAEYAGTREEEREICGEARVRDVIRVPPEDLEDLVILVNGRGARPDAPVRPGDRIVVLPHISGGLDGLPL